MKEKKKGTPKRIAALLCILFLIFMYIFTLIAACLDFPNSDRLFSACLLTTIGLPILLWIYIWLYGKITEKHTIASTDLFKESHCSDDSENASHAEDNSGDIKDL